MQFFQLIFYTGLTTAEEFPWLRLIACAIFNLKKNDCFMVLRELLFVSYCAVLWELFTVSFQSFVLCHLVSALKKLKTDEFRPRGILKTA